MTSKSNNSWVHQNKIIHFIPHFRPFWLSSSHWHILAMLASLWFAIDSHHICQCSCASRVHDAFDCFYSTAALVSYPLQFESEEQLFSQSEMQKKSQHRRFAAERSTQRSTQRSTEQAIRLLQSYSWSSLYDASKLSFWAVCSPSNSYASICEFGELPWYILATTCPFSHWECSALFGGPPALHNPHQLCHS